jgi:hypothetical protein
VKAVSLQIGITLPTFSPDSTRALGAARAAEAAGLHGVFVFDHLWPIGNPAGPALSQGPMIAATLASTERIRVGTLVARFGLLPDDVVLASLGGLAAIGGDRLIVAIGTGDSATADENERLGIPFRSASSRRESVLSAAHQLVGAGIECWVGAGDALTNEVARRAGVTLNFWGAGLDLVKRECSGGTGVTWAGPLPTERGAAAEMLRGLADAGATWAVWGWPCSLESVVEAAGMAEIKLEPTSG